MFWSVYLACITAIHSCGAPCRASLRTSGVGCFTNEKWSQVWLRLILLGGPDEEKKGSRAGGERNGGGPWERYDAVFTPPACVVCFCSATLEDTSMSGAAEGTGSSLCNRYKHVYCSALAHWREGSHYNQTRCCAQSLQFVLPFHYGDCRGVTRFTLWFFRGSVERNGSYYSHGLTGVVAFWTPAVLT